MIIWVRNLVLIIFVLSVIYTLLSISGRYKHRKRLQIEHKAAKIETDKDAYIATGLAKYDRSMRPKLFLFVFIIPIIIMAVLIYLAQYS